MRLTTLPPQCDPPEGFYSIRNEISYKVKNLKEACLLANGNIAIATENFAMEISLDKRVVWQYNQKGISSIQQIDNGNLLLGIADETCKFVEIKDGKQGVLRTANVPLHLLIAGGP